ncbi:MAG TPA: hypothetical protein VHP99_00365 [Pyrinomonadaceae bacterium]|nr:hypothetical protein [Pyrinomonadaceae bacterium]
MWHSSLTTITLVLALLIVGNFFERLHPPSGNVFAQQRLVRHDDRDDPCSRFKMRILTPADVVDRELPVKRFAEGIDSKMVWNPCPTSGPQIAFVPLVRPQRNYDLFPQFPASFQRQAADHQHEPGGFVLAPPRFTFPRAWQRP